MSTHHIIKLYSTYIICHNLTKILYWCITHTPNKNSSRRTRCGCSLCSQRWPLRMPDIPLQWLDTSVTGSAVSTNSYNFIQFLWKANLDPKGSNFRTYLVTNRQHWNCITNSRRLFFWNNYFGYPWLPHFHLPNMRRQSTHLHVFAWMSRPSESWLPADCSTVKKNLTGGCVTDVGISLLFGNWIVLWVINCNQQPSTIQGIIDQFVLWTCGLKARLAQPGSMSGFLIHIEMVSSCLMCLLVQRWMTANHLWAGRPICQFFLYCLQPDHGGCQGVWGVGVRVKNGLESFIRLTLWPLLKAVQTASNSQC